MNATRRLSISLFFSFGLLVSALPSLWAAKKIKVVTTTSTFASIVQEVAGDKADVYFIASPNRDIHFITPTPKDVLKVKNADVFVHAGLDLEAWRVPLLDAVGRTDLMPPAGERAIDVSKGISLKEIPTSLSRIQGDMHAFGNPHYWLAPSNAKIIATNIAEGLSRLYPEEADFFRKNADEFNRKIDEKMKEWRQEISPYQGQTVVAYHNSWPYFMDEFGWVILGFLEPKPGIPPTPKHMEEMIQTMKDKKTKVIVKEVFHEKKAPAKVAKATGAEVATLATEVGEIKGGDYIRLIDEDVHQLVEAFKKTG